MKRDYQLEIIDAHKKYQPTQLSKYLAGVIDRDIAIIDMHQVMIDNIDIANLSIALHRVYKWDFISPLSDITIYLIVDANKVRGGIYNIKSGKIESLVLLASVSNNTPYTYTMEELADLHNTIYKS